MTALPGQVGAYDPIDDENLTGAEAWAVKVADGVTKRITAGQVVSENQDSITVLGQRHIVRRYLDDLGAVGDGSTDDAAAINANAEAGKHYLARKGSVYAIGRQITHPLISAEGEWAEFLMLTGSGKFDQATLANAYGTNQTGFYALSQSEVVWDGLSVSMQSNGSARTCKPFAIRGCTDPKIRARMSDFKECHLSLVSWDTNTEGHWDLSAYDVNPADTGLGGLQVSVIEIDNTRISSVDSEGWVGSCLARNVYPTNSAVTAYGVQTDAVNVQGGGGGTIRWIDADTVGEVLDIFGAGTICHSIRARDVMTIVKITYGAKDNLIRDVRADGTGLWAILFAGHDNATIGVGPKRNTVSGVRILNAGKGQPALAALKPGSYGTPRAPFYVYAGTFKAEHNRVIDGYAVGLNSTVMPKVLTVADDCAGNVFDVDGENYAGSSPIDVSGITMLPTVSRRKKTRVYAYLSADTAYANGATVIHNTEVRDDLSEYDATTGIFTASNVCTLEVVINHRVIAVGAGGYCGTTLRKNSTSYEAKAKENIGASSNDLLHSHTVIVDVVPGDTIRIWAAHSASLTIDGGDASVTSLQIREV